MDRFFANGDRGAGWNYMQGGDMRKRPARNFRWRRGGWLSARMAVLSSALVLVICGIVLAYAGTERPKPASGPLPTLASATPATGEASTCSASRTCAPKPRATSATNRSAVYTPPARVELAAPVASSQVGAPFSITATVTEAGVARSGVHVTFTVTGANPQTASSTTNGAGQAAFSYTGNNAGTDHIVASFLDKTGKLVESTSVTLTWAARSASPPGEPPKKENPPLHHVQLTAPVLGKTVNVEVVSGVVFVKLPAGAQLSLAAPRAAFESLSKGAGFIPLSEARQVPVGSTLDTTEGVARVTTATAALGKVQFGEFGAGIFNILQSRKQLGLTNLKIVNTVSPNKVCATVGKKARVATRHLSKKVVGLLKGSAHGKFTTTGQYSSATVRGTIWSVTNRCDGTLTQVSRGVVSVRDFVLRKTIMVRPGGRYLAKTH